MIHTFASMQMSFMDGFSMELVWKDVQCINVNVSYMSTPEFSVNFI